MAFHEYAFYGVSVQRLLQCKIGRDVSKAAAELLAGNTAKQRLDLYRTEPDSSTAKNKNCWTWMVPSKCVYLLFRWVEVSSEWELSVPSADVPLLLCTGYALTIRGIPGHSCFLLLEWCVKCVGFFACGRCSLSLLFPCSSFPDVAWLSDGQWGGWRWGMGGEVDHWAVSMHDAHSLFSLPLWLPVGLKRNMVLTGREYVFLFFLKKEGRWGEGLSWIVRASMGRMPGC